MSVNVWTAGAIKTSKHKCGKDAMLFNYLRLAPGPTHRVEFADEDHVGGGRRVGLGQVSDHLEHHSAVVCLCKEVR